MEFRGKRRGTRKSWTRTEDTTDSDEASPKRREISKRRASYKLRRKESFGLDSKPRQQSESKETYFFQTTFSKSHTEYKFNGGAWLPMLMSYLILAAIFLPYFIVLFRGTLNPILPFVSQAAGSPPQSGIFSIFLALSALLAFIGLNLLHMALRVKKARLEDRTKRRTVAILNKVLLIPGHIGILGMIIVAGYPLDFNRHTEDWMNVTIIPHLIGAISLFIGGILFCIIFAYVMSLLHPENRRLFYVRIFLVGLILATSALQSYTVREGFMVEYNSENRLKSCVTEKIEYNEAYIVSSVCEWVLLVAFAIFFMTIQEEGRHFCFSMTMTIREEQPTPNPDVAQKEEKVREEKKDENHNVGRDKGAKAEAMVAKS